MILKNKKIVLNISNIVTANQCANITLASGASPIMSRDESDIEDLVKISSAVVVNIGTANKSDKEFILSAIKIAKKMNISIILDPVGSGASEFRTNLSKEIVKIGVSLIRANISEILSLVKNTKSYGVDSSKEHIDINELVSISNSLDTSLLISGRKDVIVSEGKATEVEGGSELMPLKTGLGCMLSSLVGALITEMKIEESAINASKIFKEMGEELFKGVLPSYDQIYNFIYEYKI